MFGIRKSMDFDTIGIGQEGRFPQGMQDSDRLEPRFTSNFTSKMR